MVQSILVVITMLSYGMSVQRRLTVNKHCHASTPQDNKYVSLPVFKERYRRQLLYLNSSKLKATFRWKEFVQTQAHWKAEFFKTGVG